MNVLLVMTKRKEPCISFLKVLNKFRMPSLDVTRGTESQQRQIVSESAGRAGKIQQGSPL